MKLFVITLQWIEDGDVSVAGKAYDDLGEVEQAIRDMFAALQSGDAFTFHTLGWHEDGAGALIYNKAQRPVLRIRYTEVQLARRVQCVVV